MSKVSVFKFNTNGASQEIIENTIKEFLNLQGFKYDSNNNCYMVATAVTNTFSCFSYLFTNDQLVITAFTYNSFSGLKNYIQPGFNTLPVGKTYYDDINNNLFTPLSNNNIVLVSSEKEDLKDGAGMNFFIKILIIVIPVIIVFAIITFIAYIRSHG